MARVAVYAGPAQPPRVESLSADDAANLVEELFCRVAALARVPALALREVIENLVHARFSGALVSVLDGGSTVRVSDRGPGIGDVERALLPGYTTADAEARRIIRGVGCGLPLASALMAERGGALVLEENLSGGAVATLAMPTDHRDIEEPAVPAPSETARRLLALLVELSPADPGRLAAELEVPLAECGRELVLLEHRGLVSRAASGERALAEDGTALVATLF